MDETQAVDLNTLTARLAEAGDDFEQVQLSDDASIVISARTARLYGPFFNGRDPIGWVPTAFESAAGFRALQESANWNLGGERLWLSPELEYFVADRRDFWNTYAVPRAIDPGLYELSRIDAGLCLRMSFDLRSARTGEHQATVIQRRIVEVDPPSGLPRDVRAARYREEISVDSVLGQPPVVPWIVRQVGLGGRIAIPAPAGARAGSIVGPLPEEARIAGADGFVFDLHEGELFKAAFAARDILPAIAYVIPLGATACGIVLAYDGSAEEAYFEEPPDKPGDSGYSAFVFRDDGRFGGYAELEVVGHPEHHATSTGKRSTLRLTTTALLGETPDVTGSIQSLLKGTELSD
jgi:hypothetical protein